MLRFLVALLVGVGATASASAASWADSMFEELSRDFGSVPRGPALNHAFRLTNKTGQPVHIAGVRVSCGCTNASALQADLAPGQSTAIVAVMDTTRFAGVKTVTIYVQFDRPQWEEVRLWVQGNARDDVTVAPESLAFGQVKRGTDSTSQVNITFLGSGQWRIAEAACDSNYVQTQVQELRRDANEVAYQVTAHIRPDTPVGKWYTDVWLKTNNVSTPRVRIPLTVEVESALNVSPAVANLGQVKTGGQAERKVIVRGVKPFRITGVRGEDAQLSVKDSTADSKPVHVLTVRLKGERAGELNRTLHILTDLKDESEVEFQAIARIVP
jgi:uncharacterized protein DUF1573